MMRLMKCKSVYLGHFLLLSRADALVQLGLKCVPNMMYETHLVHRATHLFKDLHKIRTWIKKPGFLGKKKKESTIT